MVLYHSKLGYVNKIEVQFTLSEAESITERLKAGNQLLWVQRVNNVRERAAEIVTAELIYA